MPLKDAKGTCPMGCVQSWACPPIPHHVEVETQCHRAPSAHLPKPVPANLVYGRPMRSRVHHTPGCRPGSKTTVVDSIDTAVPGIAAGCWDYTLGPQYVRMLGPRLSHPVWTLCMQLARPIATLDVEAGPARDGDPAPSFPSPLPVAPVVGTVSRSVHGSGARVARILSPPHLWVVTFPPAGASPKEAAPANHREVTFNCKRPPTLPTKTMGRSTIAHKIRTMDLVATWMTIVPRALNQQQHRPNAALRAVAL